jgi:hypothetical protein
LKRRASAWLVCHPLMVTVSHDRAPTCARRRRRFARVDGVEAIDRQRHRHADRVRIAQPDGIFALARLDVQAPVMGVAWLWSSLNQDVDGAAWMTNG